MKRTIPPYRLLMAMAGLSAALIQSAAAASPDPAAGATPASAAAVRLPEWPQAHSDLPADPAVRFGVLANGMRYAITHNSTPSKAVSVRLRIGAGSLDESESQQGLAHFLEHMAFRGSTHVPDGEVKNRLERLGLKFGPDINAFTAPTQTVYMFDLPRNDRESLDSALDILREMCDRLLLDAHSLDAERGVVLAEARLRDTPGYRVSVAQQQLLLEGQLAPQRQPIGSTEVLRAATAQQLREFYRSYYRPERATLLVVGDVDLADMAARIEAQFGDWHNAAPDPAAPSYGVPPRRGATARAYSETGATSGSLLAWVAPYDDAPDTLAHEQHDLIEQIALGALTRRLQAAAAGTAHEYTTAGTFRQNLLHSAQITTLLVQHDEGAWQKGLAAADAVRRQALQQGLRADEVERAMADLRTQFQVAASGAATRESGQIAADLLANVDLDGVYTGPARDLEVAEATFRDLKLERVNAALREAFAGSGPLAFVSSPSPIAGGDAGVLAAVAAAERGSVAAAESAQKLVWPYPASATAGRVSEQRRIDDPGLSEVRFANGVRLNVKTTKFATDQILIAVRVGNGRLDLPRDQHTPVWAMPGMVSLGGLGKLDLPALQQLTAGKEVGVQFQLADDAFVYSGGTRAADLSLQLQLLLATIADPGWRAEAFERVRSVMQNQLAQISANPGALFNTQRDSLVRSGDARWALPTSAEVRAASVSQLSALMSEPLAHGPIEVTVVGDLSLSEAIQAVATTFGALPARSGALAKAQPGALHFAAPTALPATLEHQGRAEQGLAAAAWPTTDALSDLPGLSARNVLSEVMQQRLFAQLRQRLSTSYTPQVMPQNGTVFPGFGVLLATADMPPERAADFYAAVAAMAADLRSKPVSPDELERVRGPMVEKLQQAFQNNGFWLVMLQGVQEEPRQLERVRRALVNLKAVTAGDVQAAANRFLVDDKEWKLIVEKAGAAGEVGSGAQAGSHGSP